MKRPVTIKSALTKDEIIQGLLKVGVMPGMTLEVHGSLSSFGFVIGGAQSVVDALLEVLGPEGTLLMPLHMGLNSEPSSWYNPSIEIELIDKVREAIPPFDKMASEAYGMGALVDNLRRRDGVVTSSHPNVAFIAKGKYANLLCNHQSLHFPLSSESPVARLYEIKGFCLLLGVDFDRCTSMHLSEYATDCRSIVVKGSCVIQGGKKVWKKYLDLDLNSDEFLIPGRALESLGKVIKGKIGSCQVKFFSINDAVDEATRYFETKQGYELYR
ncbi:MAG: AAC(3) family N-acetyltransferase [Erysipelotrichaceae bacterium]|jgi:aminoglycoside 3-N-acetyltransferase|nr:AAC(3) family N-acetyltransferase [Bacillota bacterium]NLP22862.1 AAC(3) family N-acetyltransferase [Erysipelotrichaceae bacterium]HCY06986.1 AAC(3) family N-acetyltransferase [Erysipelotrichaceae bacterium]